MRPQVVVSDLPRFESDTLLEEAEARLEGVGGEERASLRRNKVVEDDRHGGWSAGEQGAPSVQTRPKFS